MKLYLSFMGCLVIVFACSDISFNLESGTVTVLRPCAMVMENTWAGPVNKHPLPKGSQQLRISPNPEHLREVNCAISGLLFEMQSCNGLNLQIKTLL